MLRSKRNAHSHFRYCGYGCCGPRIGKKRERRIMRKAEKRGWKKDAVSA